MSLPPPPAPTACYRHPDREAGRRCTRCGKPACTECLVQAAVGSHCVDCAKAARPDVKTRARYWNARQATLVTYALIAINVLVFVYLTIDNSRSLGGATNSTGYERLGLARDLLAHDIVGYPSLPDGLPGQWYRLITSGFVHYGIIHLGFNMYALYALGQTLEPSLGRVRFALVYFAAMLGGGAGALLLQPNGLHGGASGAVFGLFGLITVGYVMRGINPFSTALGGVLLINLFLSLRPGISFGGHLGGFVAGALCGLAVVAPGHRRIPQEWTYVVPIAVAAISVAICVATAA
jgi:membrane associated rhomboid family serine protease